MCDYVESRPSILHTIVALDAPPAERRYIKCHKFSHLCTMPWRCNEMIALVNQLFAPHVSGLHTRRIHFIESRDEIETVFCAPL